MRLPNLRLPARRFLGVILVRSCVIWLGVRGALAILGHVRLDGPAPAGVVLVAVALCRLESLRSGESLFLQNLGVPPWVVMSLTAVCPVLFELALVWVSP